MPSGQPPGRRRYTEVQARSLTVAFPPVETSRLLIVKDQAGSARFTIYDLRISARLANDSPNPLKMEIGIEEIDATFDT